MLNSVFISKRNLENLKTGEPKCGLLPGSSYSCAWPSVTTAISPDGSVTSTYIAQLVAARKAIVVDTNRDRKAAPFDSSLDQGYPPPVPITHYSYVDN